MCRYCVNFATQTIDELLNIILNIGVIGTCKELCNYLPSQTGITVLRARCVYLCNIVGIQTFTSIVVKSDLDAIYMCELLKVCRIYDEGDATITSFKVSPTSGPQGIFNMAVSYTSKNGTGTGQIRFDVKTVDKFPVGETFFFGTSPAGIFHFGTSPAGIFHFGTSPAGIFHLSFKLNAKIAPDCDPAKMPCEKWSPGNYAINMAICNGECDSTSPHSDTYDEAQAVFTITD